MWEVQIDNFTDVELERYGWYRVDTGHTFSKFFNSKQGEQAVKNDPPRFIVVDDINDARFMERDGAKVVHCPKKI